MSTYSDLSGIFYVQQQYLADLSALSQADPGSSGEYINTLRKQLGDAYNAYSSANPAANAILNKQDDMLNIITNEKDRLDRKMQTVDAALYGQRRMAHFSNSYSKKYYAQIKILFVVILLLLIYLALSYIDNYIPVPSIVWVIAILLFGGTGLLVIIFTIRDINRRYHMDFDKLDTYAPAGSDARGGNGNANFNGLVNKLLCIGENCCPPGNKDGAVWDANAQQCISAGPDATAGTKAQSIEGFSSMVPSSCGNNSNQLSSQVSPYEPTEITKYTKI